MSSAFIYFYKLCYFHKISHKKVFLATRNMLTNDQHKTVVTIFVRHTVHIEVRIETFKSTHTHTQALSYKGRSILIRGT